MQLASFLYNGSSSDFKYWKKDFPPDTVAANGPSSYCYSGEDVEVIQNDDKAYVRRINGVVDLWSVSRKDQEAAINFWKGKATSCQCIGWATLLGGGAGTGVLWWKNKLGNLAAGGTFGGVVCVALLVFDRMTIAYDERDKWAADSLETVIEKRKSCALNSNLICEKDYKKFYVTADEVKSICIRTEKNSAHT